MPAARRVRKRADACGGAACVLASGTSRGTQQREETLLLTMRPSSRTKPGGRRGPEGANVGSKLHLSSSIEARGATLHPTHIGLVPGVMCAVWQRCPCTCEMSVLCDVLACAGGGLCVMAGALPTSSGASCGVARLMRFRWQASCVHGALWRHPHDSEANEC